MTSKLFHDLCVKKCQELEDLLCTIKVSEFRGQNIAWSLIFMRNVCASLLVHKESEFTLAILDQIHTDILTAYKRLRMTTDFLQKAAFDIELMPNMQYEFNSYSETAKQNRLDFQEFLKKGGAF
jgi:hypothetical protein